MPVPAPDSSLRLRRNPGLRPLDSRFRGNDGVMSTQPRLTRARDNTERGSAASLRIAAITPGGTASGGFAGRAGGVQQHGASDGSDRRAGGRRGRAPGTGNANERADGGPDTAGSDANCPAGDFDRRAGGRAVRAPGAGRTSQCRRIAPKGSVSPAGDMARCQSGLPARGVCLRAGSDARLSGRDGA